MNIRVPGPPGTLIEIRPAGADPAEDHAALLDLVHRLNPTGSPAAATIGHRCAHCGSRTHGRPLLLTAEAEENPAIHVSLSRSSGHLAMVASLSGPVGIDLEHPAAVSRAPLDAAFSPRERAHLRALTNADECRTHTAVAWCAKEAVSKLLGTGLRTDPSTLEIELAPDGSLSAHLTPGVTLTRLEVPSPLVAVLAHRRQGQSRGNDLEYTHASTTEATSAPDRASMISTKSSVDTIP